TEGRPRCGATRRQITASSSTSTAVITSEYATTRDSARSTTESTTRAATMATTKENRRGRRSRSRANRPPGPNRSPAVVIGPEYPIGGWRGASLASVTGPSSCQRRDGAGRDPYQLCRGDREHVGPGARCGPDLVVPKEILVDIDR